MTERDPESISKQMRVRDALETGPIQPCIVRQEEDLRQTVECLCDRPGIRTVAVVDAEGRLVGIIPLRLLLDELFLSIAPEEFLIDMREMAGVEEFGRISRAAQARDLMIEPVSITLDDSVRDAFIKMHERNLGGLPIVDQEGKVSGYLDRLNLIRLWLRRPSEGQGR